MTLAGFPPTMAKSGMSFVTTEHAPMMTPVPICLQPGNTVTLAPIQTSFSINNGAFSS